MSVNKRKNANFASKFQSFKERLDKTDRGKSSERA